MIKYVLMLLGGYVVYYITIMIMDASKKKAKLLDSDNSLGSFDLSDASIKKKWGRKNKKEESFDFEELEAVENAPINIMGFDDEETLNEKVFEKTAVNEFSGATKNIDEEDGYAPIPASEENPFDPQAEQLIEEAKENKEKAVQFVEDNNKGFEEVKKTEDSISYKKLYPFDTRGFFDIDVNSLFDNCGKVVVFAP